MIMINLTLTLKTAGNTDVIDLTPFVADSLVEHKVLTGNVLLFIPGSTAALTTIEYERGVIQDLKDAIERIVPHGIHYTVNLFSSDQRLQSVPGSEAPGHLG